MEGHSFNEAGRRVKAAVISYQMGDAGVDRALKGIPDDPGEGWAALAESLLRGMQPEVVGNFWVDGSRPEKRFNNAKRGHRITGGLCASAAEVEG
jgi:hypothetical protein